MAETNRIEYKQELTDSLEKEVIAFLNYAAGGLIYIGIDKVGKTAGVTDSDGDQLKIKDRLKHNISPSCLGLFDVISEHKDGLDIIKIIVASGSEKPYFLKKYGMTEKGAFIRIGTASEPMPQKMIDALFAKRTRNSISKIRSNQQNLSFEQLKIYYEGVGKSLNNNFAANLELLNAEEQYNYLAYLISDKNSTSIKLARYNGLTRANLVENNEYGYESLIKATKQVLDKVNLENKTFTQITSKERKETRYWDAIALREAIINAFVHNDYTTEVPPKFELFDDRIEITSTGGLPDGLSQDEFFEGFSVPRNKEIMRIYKDLDLVEQLGSGIPRILESYSKDCFKFSDNFLRMSLPVNDQANDQANDQVNDQVNDQAKAKDLMEHLKASLDSLGTVKRDLMVELKMPTEKQVEKYAKLAAHLTAEQLEILKFSGKPKSNKEIQEDCLGLKRHNDNFKRYIEPLINLKLLNRTLPNVPNSPQQKYYTTEIGNIILLINDYK
ncbi:RNA-binding domain-containing protein [Pedobacter rhodius]|uniref:DNA binding domain-containing protein n=1 Tax=Pedobacter rhodius TaxID=3004098 RepID=A0ABT4KYM3_9SPHI|nr:RNA-binding domain-containing protein [Pedobacter sp. SJ11]MCZ4223307.1 putative DNA binding domain-containing protein [Pedobacter sp. SJ11]